jgi:hypothetical protein
MEPIQRIMIQTEVFGQTLSANRSMEHAAQRCSVHGTAVNAKPDDATRELVHHNQNPMGLQGGGLASEQIATPQTVLCMAEKCRPGWTC